jgi:hypothetical protein
MTLQRIMIAGLVALVAACVYRTFPPVEISPIERTVDYLADVAPVLEARCAVCHSCYNAPCQLKLSSFEGLDRGGSKIPVYSGARLDDQAPTRLFTDARTTREWRAKGFHAVTKNTATAGSDDSILMTLLDAKRRHPEISGTYHAEAEDLSCASDRGELAEFLAKHPDRGMPFGFPGISEDELETIGSWLQQGGAGPSPEQQARLTAPSRVAASEIEKWEAFLNHEDAKHALTARYLYEHFFLAHVNFKRVGPGEFYELVRSTTPSGQGVAPIPTVRPYDDPGVGRFYYRFRKIHSTIVHKTHIVVEFDDRTLARYRELFIDTPWIESPHAEVLDAETDANPFLAYAQIPPDSRYRFMLDHSEYFLRTFIRGPVCKGQIALNVVNDHFWVMFMDPAADASVTHPDFLTSQAANLRMPTELGSDGELLETFSNEYRKLDDRFYRAKTGLYERVVPEGLGLDAIWKGRRARDAPVLTIYRHFDSGSVHKGVLGALPRTLWVIDYPQLERIYYNLVAGFDVFGNITHQVNVRRYMDYLRIEGEANFLNFLPKEDRYPTLERWYVGDKALDNVDVESVLTERDTRIVYRTDSPKREFIERVVDDHILKSTGITFDEINYLRADDPQPVMPEKFETHADFMSGLRALTVPGTGFIRHITASEANLALMRVRNFEGSDHLVSIVVNRWHDNVNSMFRETSRLDPSKDTIEFHYGSIGSYPNVFIDLEGKDLPDLFDLLENFDGSAEYRAKFERYGIQRSDPRFWSIYDWFQQRFDSQDPLQAGLYDLNRYRSETHARPESGGQAVDSAHARN